MVEREYCYREVLPFAAMITVECTNVGVNTLFKAASLKGMSYYIFMFYSRALSTLLLLPLLFIFRRFSGQIFGYAGISYSSPTLASATSDLTPAYTFILAVIFRMEKLALRSSSTQAKIMGTIVSISGAIVVVLFKGPTLISTPPPSSSIPLHQPLGSSQSNWVIGSFLLASQHLLTSIWSIVQWCRRNRPASIIHVAAADLHHP